MVVLVVDGLFFGGGGGEDHEVGVGGGVKAVGFGPVDGGDGGDACQGGLHRQLDHPAGGDHGGGFSLRPPHCAEAMGDIHCL